MTKSHRSDSLGTLISPPDGLRDSLALLKPLTGDIQALIAANAGSTFADRGLVPIAWLSDGGYWLLVSINGHRATRSRHGWFSPSRAIRCSIHLSRPLQS